MNGPRSRPGAASFACLALVVLTGACGGASPRTPLAPGGVPPVAIPPLSGALAAVGTIGNRVTGDPIYTGESTIEFVGTVSSSGTARQGAFRVEGLVEGTYEVRIRGTGHVDHVTKNVPVGPGPVTELRFSVIPWGAQRFGAVYSPLYHDYFHWIARGTDVDALRKWDLERNPPREIYVGTTEKGTAVPVAREVFDYAMGLIRTVNEQMLPDMFCGNVEPLPIRTGPTLHACPEYECAETIAPGQIVFEFVTRQDQTPGWASVHTRNPSLTIPEGMVVLNTVWLRRAMEGDVLHTREYMEYVVPHETYHVAFAGHRPTTLNYSFSLMGRSPVMAPDDKLASCIVYHPHTAVGNQQPDVNPSYWRSNAIAIQSAGR